MAGTSAQSLLQYRRGRSETTKAIMKIERILCPTDLSPDSDEALRYAVAMTRAYEAELIVLHCAQPGSEFGMLNGKARDLFQPSLSRHLATTELMNFAWTGVVTEGDDPGACITAEAARRNIDLIVMRSRRRPTQAALLGSTAESVCRTAPCPVMVMHSDERDWVDDVAHGIELRRVLVAYDFSDHSELGLKYGLSFAQEYQAELHLLHVLPNAIKDPEIAWYPMGTDGAYHKAARRLQKTVPPEAHLWCKVKDAISEGQPYREILSYAERNKIDLICIGAHGAGFGMRALFGSNVDRVLRQAPCPVLVTRPLKPATVQSRERILQTAIAV